jgi:hypothetical protein
MKNMIYTLLQKTFNYITFDIQPPHDSLLDRLSLKIIDLQIWIKGNDDNG